MIDVFFCTLDTPPDLRRGMRELCWGRWSTEPKIRLHALTPSGLGVASYEFQRQRRIHAEERATSDIYLVIDDDILPPRDAQLSEIVATMRNYPDFAILTPLWTNAKIYPWGPENYTPFVNDDVMEHESVGGARFCRKGAMRQWPEMDTPHPKHAWNSEHKPPAYDRLQCDTLRGAGFRVGFLRQHFWTHLGEGYSSVW